MGYITLAQSRQRTRGLPKSGNAEGCTISISALGGITVRIGTTPQGQGHRTVCAQVVADASRRRAEGRRRPDRGRHLDLAVDGRVRKLLLALLGRRGRCSRRGSGAARGEGRRDPSSPGGRERLASPGRRHRALEPGGAPGRHGARARGDGVLGRAESPPARRRRPRRLVRGPRLRRRRRGGRGRPRDRRGDGARLRHRARRRPAAEPSARRGPGARRVRPRRGGRALRAPRLRRRRKPPHRLVHGLPRADRARPADAADRAPRVALAVHPRSARRAWARGTR